MKTISVVMATFNGAEHLKEQLDSILRQSLAPDEIIIQDDGSTDATLDIVRDYAKADSRIKLFVNDAEHGINNNFFGAIQKATGDYIAISDQDDIWVDDKLKWQIEAIGEKLLCSGFSMPYPSSNRDVRIPNHHLLRLLFIGSSMPGHTLFFDRKLLERIPDAETLRTVKTYDNLLSIVAAAYDSVAYVEKPLVLHRLHAASATYNGPVSNRKSIANLFSHVVNDFRLFRELRPEVTRRLGVLLECMKKMDSTEAVYRDAITMLTLFVGNSPGSLLRLQLFCARHAEHLFYAKERKSLVTMLRGLYFPFSCYEYYRYLSHSRKSYLPLR